MLLTQIVLLDANATCLDCTCVGGIVLTAWHEVGSLCDCQPMSLTHLPRNRHGRHEWWLRITAAHVTNVVTAHAMNCQDGSVLAIVSCSDCAARAFTNELTALPQ